MTINLTAEQIAWLKALAAERGYASVDEAAQAVIAEAMLTSPEEPDPDWIVPLLDEARAEIARGESIPLDDFRKHLKSRIEKLDR